MAGENHPFILRPLGGIHNRAEFTCGDVRLDRYIQHYAGQDKKRDLAACHVLTRVKESSRILGYFTLSSYSVDMGELPGDLTKGLPGYPEVPAVLLGRLAVASNYQGNGLGEVLLLHAFDYVLMYTNKIAARLLVVDARNQRAAGFYNKYGFKPLPTRELTLVLPIDTIRAAFNE